MKFNLAKFRNLRDEITSSLAEAETDVIELFADRKALIEQIAYNEALLKSYKKELKLLGCGTVNDYIAFDLDQDILNLDEFIYGLEDDLEEIDAEINGIERELRHALDHSLNLIWEPCSYSN